MRILVVLPTQKLCGIYQAGLKVAKHLKPEWEVKTLECASFDMLRVEIEQYHPDVTLYATAHMVCPFVYDQDVRKLPGKHIGLSHEAEQCMLEGTILGNDSFNSPWFDAWVAFDPTLVIPPDNKRCFQATRPLTRASYIPPPPVPTFGCQCFGFDFRGHRQAVQAVVNEYDEAVIRFNMPPSYWGDRDNDSARNIAQDCQRIADQKPGVEFRASFEFWDDEDDIIRWAGSNTANMYFYHQWDVPGSMRGIASSPDVSLSARRPCIVSGSTMMRHLHPYFGQYAGPPTIHAILEIAERTEAVKRLYDEWTPEAMRQDMKKVFEAIL